VTRLRLHIKGEKKANVGERKKKLRCSSKERKLLGERREKKMEIFQRNRGREER